MINVGIIGAAGYTGQTLLSILLSHKHVNVAAITSATFEGQSLSNVFPVFAGTKKPLVFEKPDYDSIVKRCDTFFLCLPHRESMEAAAKLLDAGKVVFDLSADFRLKDHAVYEKWYGVTHTKKDLLASAVYGLPELHGDKIKNASLVAVPGCYPTSAILGLAPVLGESFIDKSSIVINSVSGVSGAGKKAMGDFMLAELEGNFYAYGAPSHRHTPEIEQEFSALTGEKTMVTFIPHLLPTTRGIYTTITAKLTEDKTSGEILNLYKSFYSGSRFVSVHDTFPRMKWAIGSNRLYVSAMADERTSTLIVTSTIDNLVKGASGQAVQCFNIRYGFDEKVGLGYE
ncbi:N-acetyl-gamma-glutamyl-phosphate reductase [hydrothermal vent metagenome]|uniref:N-acetyl-gamma-glutamyl-phosphate reductase n=1 Tax=hydrothermal vent metagenome TaxID=652676 RepID=A0A3B1BD74_9ZZZZ